jgi:hypothetical protein
MANNGKPPLQSWREFIERTTPDERMEVYTAIYSSLCENDRNCLDESICALRETVIRRGMYDGKREKFSDAMGIELLGQLAVMMVLAPEMVTREVLWEG